MLKEIVKKSNCQIFEFNGKFCDRLAGSHTLTFVNVRGDYLNILKICDACYIKYKKFKCRISNIEDLFYSWEFILDIKVK